MERKRRDLSCSSPSSMAFGRHTIKYKRQRRAGRVYRANTRQRGGKETIFFYCKSQLKPLITPDIVADMTLFCCPSYDAAVLYPTELWPGAPCSTPGPPRAQRGGEAPLAAVSPASGRFLGAAGGRSAGPRAGLRLPSPPPPRPGHTPSAGPWSPGGGSLQHHNHNGH